MSAILLCERLPGRDELVVCYRCTGPNLFSVRNTDKPHTVHDDLSRDAWWRGEGSARGYEWSDGTVVGWEPIPTDAAKELRRLWAVNKSDHQRWSAINTIIELEDEDMDKVGAFLEELEAGEATP